MNISYVFRNVTSSEGIRNYAGEKIERLGKYTRAPIGAEVIFDKERHLHQVEIQLLADGQKYVARHESEDMYASIDLAIDKLDRQLRDHKEVVTQHKR